MLEKVLNKNCNHYWFYFHLSVFCLISIVVHSTELIRYHYDASGDGNQLTKRWEKKSKLWYGAKMMRLSRILYKRFMLRVCMVFIATALPNNGSKYISYNNITQSKNFLKPIEALVIFWFQVIFCWCGIWYNASGSVLYLFPKYFFWYFLHRVFYRITKQI